MNILICSAGRRVKLINYFKEELEKVKGKLIAVDCDKAAPALYFADAYEIVPRITEPDYIKILKGICQKYQVDAVLSLIDPELLLFAENRGALEEAGVKLVLSDKHSIELCFDKYLTYQFLKNHDLPFVPTFLKFDEVKAAIDKNEVSFPLIAKPRKGSASIGIEKVNSLTELQVLINNYDDLIVQPFIEGEEYGVDCYIDMITHKTTNIFIKRKLKMRAGETDKSIAVKDPDLNIIIKKLVDVLKPVGPIDIDCFKTELGYVISEINPRFGGGYLHAHELGQNFPRNIINNLSGLINECNIGNYREGSILIKFDNHKLIEV